MEDTNSKKAYDNFDYHFSQISDPRQSWKVIHPLSEILFICVLAIISGAEDISEISDYAQTKRKWLMSFLTLPGGIPSHDTFNRILCAIDPKEFEQCFVDWISDYLHQLPIRQDKDDPDIIPIDGKTIRKSEDKGKANKAIHMVSALSTQSGMILGQRKCNEKSNEITAIPLLLKILDIAGCIITIDAMGCQKNIARQICEKGADYVLALKGNQGNLAKEVEGFFNKTEQPEFAHYKYEEDIEHDKGHGRIETRHCKTITNLQWLIEPQSWDNLKSIAQIKATVIKNGIETQETRYYISSLSGNAKQMNRAIRKHWAIENSLHWVLDVTFNEDQCRVRTGNGAENLSIMRRVALNAIKNDKTAKASLKIRRKQAGWDDNYALIILAQIIVNR
jgi:predicted transposase YbfD/YdcC